MSAQPIYNYLKQSHFLFGKREFIIKDGDALLVRERSWSRQHETLIPLQVLDPSPTYSASFAVKWLLHSLFMGSLSGLMFYWAKTQSMLLLYLIAALFTGTTLVLLYRFFLYTTRLVIFRHAHTNENFLYLWRNKPDTQQFERFIDELSRLIRQQALASDENRHKPAPALRRSPSPAAPAHT